MDTSCYCPLLHLLLLVLNLVLQYLLYTLIQNNFPDLYMNSPIKTCPLLCTNFNTTLPSPISNLLSRFGNPICYQVKCEYKQSKNFPPLKYPWCYECAQTCTCAQNQTCLPLPSFSTVQSTPQVAQPIYICRPNSSHYASHLPVSSHSVVPNMYVLLQIFVYMQT
jgi:hypothetical protein